MANFSALFGAYNVEGSLNEWFRVNITAQGTPAWMPSARVVTDYSREQPLIFGYSGHAFALTHLPQSPLVEFEGGIADGGTGGRIMKGTLEADGWISKSVHQQTYQARIRQMRDMISRMVGSGRAVMITNVYSSTASAPGLAAIVNVRTPRFEPAGPDPNPDLVRVRALMDYTWNERVA